MKNKIICFIRNVKEKKIQILKNNIKTPKTFKRKARKIE
jgi:hypothetical protein